jgi:very-short-patch-repair endonuclease
MHRRTTPKIFGRAKKLHRDMTPPEAKLWAYLRAHNLAGVHFRNQHAIGNYVVDFCAPRRKLVIELDDSKNLEMETHDSGRTRFLESRGYKIIRFWNNDVMNDIEGVLERILIELEEG